MLKLAYLNDMSVNTVLGLGFIALLSCLFKVTCLNDMPVDVLGLSFIAYDHTCLR